MLTLLVFIALIVASSPASVPSRQTLRSTGTSTGTLSATTGIKSAIVQAALPGIQKIVGGFLNELSNALFHHDPYTRLLHRIVKLTSSGTTVTIQDTATGFSVSRSGSTTEQALELATRDLLALLLQAGFISIHDLHLAPSHTTTATPCGDAFPITYCQRNRDNGYCVPNHALYTFMHMSCYKTCTEC